MRTPTHTGMWNKRLKAKAVPITETKMYEQNVSMRQSDRLYSLLGPCKFLHCRYCSHDKTIQHVRQYNVRLITHFVCYYNSYVPIYPKTVLTLANILEPN